MITEQYVSFETAQLLKEAGFDALCNSMYTDNGFGWSDLDKVNYNEYETSYSRPTQSLAAKWLREVYNVAIYSLYDDDMEQWFYVVDAFTKNPVINGFQSDSEYDDYESAFEDGLREAIKLIKR